MWESAEVPMSAIGPSTTRSRAHGTNEPRGHPPQHVNVEGRGHRSLLLVPIALIPHANARLESRAREMTKRRTQSAEKWVVLWATSPTSNYMALPRVVAKILGCTRENLAKLGRPQRGIAFLARPELTVRVVGMHRHADLVAQALRQNEVVGIAKVTPTKVTFNIPDAVEEHLGLQTYLRPGKKYAVTGRDDTLAWIMPASEYYPFRRAEREGEPWTHPEGGAHIYLRRSLFLKL